MDMAEAAKRSMILFLSDMTDEQLAEIVQAVPKLCLRTCFHVDNVYCKHDCVQCWERIKKSRETPKSVCYPNTEDCGCVNVSLSEARLINFLSDLASVEALKEGQE